MHLFWVKRVSGNYFTPLCVFGKLRKFGQMEINFRVDRKITLFWCKTILAFILPSNQLQDSKMKRERVREHIHHRPAKLRHRSPITDPSSPILHTAQPSSGTNTHHRSLITTQPSSSTNTHHRSLISAHPPSSPIHKHPRPSSPIALHFVLVITTQDRSCSQPTQNQSRRRR